MSNRSRGFFGRFAAAIVVGVLICQAAPTARADYEETELRLKAAGIDDDLRAKIHEAIRRGAAYLLGKQAKDGSFDDPPYGAGLTALCSAALAHAGTRDARAGAELGMSRLLPKGRPCSAVISETYTAGLTAMLLLALHGEASAGRSIADAAAAVLFEGHDWWGYQVGEGASEGRQLENISTTQYGALALWAGGRVAGAAHPEAWRRHLDVMCSLQTDDGSWAYRPRKEGRGYPTGTCIGFADVTLARAAIEDDLADDPILAARSEIALRRARAALERDATTILALEGARGYGDLYALYALEKACVFADLEVVGGKRWYRVAAATLVAAQNRDGGWGIVRGRTVGGGLRVGESGTIDTSFALLFLLRSSENFRPVTPRDVDAPRQVATPGTAHADARDAPVAPPTPPPMTAQAADAALDRLDALLRDRHSARPELLRELDDLERVRTTLGAAAADAWLDRAERLLVKTFRDSFPRTASEDEVLVRTCRALAGSRPSVSGPMREAMGNALVRESARAPSRVALGAAFATLARLGEAASFDWLVARVSAGVRVLDVRCARAALAALSTFQGQGAIDRMQAVSKIVRVLEVVEQASSSTEDDVDALAAKIHWSALGAPALIALEQLCTDPRTSAAPVDANGAPLLSVADYGRWLVRHRDVKAAPWR